MSENLIGNINPLNVDARIEKAIGDLDQELSNRIDNLVLNSGDSPAEVADAHLGANGNVYNTLKERLDTENSELKSEINAERTRAIERENEIENLFSAPTQEAVNAWLNEHPEATTTVKDHSLSIDKMIVGTLGYVTPEMFGAAGDGITYDTLSFNNMLCNVADNTVIMCGVDKKYKINDIVLVNDRHHITILNGHFLLKDSEDVGTVFQIGENSSFITFRNCTFVGGSQVIHLFTCNNVTIDNCVFIENRYSIIQQNGYVSDNVFVTDNFAFNLFNDFVECNCETNAPSKNWIVTGNIFTSDTIPETEATECRFLGATRIGNIVISDNIVENVKGDACVHLENALGNIVVSNNVFKNSRGVAYVYVMHYGKKTVITNNHFANEIADNNTPFIYLYGNSGEEALDIIVNNNIMIGNGTQNAPIRWDAFTTEVKMISGNVIKGINAMFNGNFTINKWHFTNNIVECNEFINTYTEDNATRIFKTMDFIDNDITGNIDLRNDFNGSFSSDIRIKGNRIKGNVSLQMIKDAFVFDNVIEEGYTFTFLPNSWGAERMYQGNNYIVRTGLYEVTA